MPAMNLLKAVQAIEAAGLRSEIMSRIACGTDVTHLWVAGWEIERGLRKNVVVCFKVTGGAVDPVSATNIRERLATYKVKESASA
jgi:hypothetical protein